MTRISAFRGLDFFNEWVLALESDAQGIHQGVSMRAEPLPIASRVVSFRQLTDRRVAEQLAVTTDMETTRADAQRYCHARYCRR